jgi:hypothetical protein
VVPALRRIANGRIRFEASDDGAGHACIYEEGRGIDVIEVGQEDATAIG